VFVLTDGERFRCSGSAYEHATPTPGTLEHGRGCVALSRLAIPRAARAAFAALETARTCLANKAVRVTGGPVFPQQSPTSPDGELIAGGSRGAAFIAFYADVGSARRLEPSIEGNARRFGGQVQRRGAVTVIWVHHPSGALRHAVRACVVA
jgi:hypothetical protein